MQNRYILKKECKELIGAHVEVVGSTNKGLVGLRGRVVDETRNMIMLENNKKIVKSQAILKVNFGTESYVIDGRLLVGAPEDRLKRSR